MASFSNSEYLSICKKLQLGLHKTCLKQIFCAHGVAVYIACCFDGMKQSFITSVVPGETEASWSVTKGGPRVLL